MNRLIRATAGLLIIGFTATDSIAAHPKAKAMRKDAALSAEENAYRAELWKTDQEISPLLVQVPPRITEAYAALGHRAESPFTARYTYEFNAALLSRYKDIFQQDGPSDIQTFFSLIDAQKQENLIGREPIDSASDKNGTISLFNLAPRDGAGLNQFAESCRPTAICEDAQLVLLHCEVLESKFPKSEVVDRCRFARIWKEYLKQYGSQFKELTSFAAAYPKSRFAPIARTFAAMNLEYQQRNPKAAADAYRSIARDYPDFKIMVMLNDDEDVPYDQSGFLKHADDLSRRPKH